MTSPPTITKLTCKTTTGKFGDNEIYLLTATMTLHNEESYASKIDGRFTWAINGTVYLSMNTTITPVVIELEPQDELIISKFLVQAIEITNNLGLEHELRYTRS